MVLLMSLSNTKLHSMLGFALLQVNIRATIVDFCQGDLFFIWCWWKKHCTKVVQTLSFRNNDTLSTDYWEMLWDCEWWPPGCNFRQLARKLVFTLRPKLHNSCFFFAHLTSALGRLNNRIWSASANYRGVCVSAHALAVYYVVHRKLLSCN